MTSTSLAVVVGPSWDGDVERGCLSLIPVFCLFSSFDDSKQRAGSDAHLGMVVQANFKWKRPL